MIPGSYTIDIRPATGNGAPAPTGSAGAANVAVSISPANALMFTAACEYLEGGSLLVLGNVSKEASKISARAPNLRNARRLRDAEAAQEEAVVIHASARTRADRWARVRPAAMFLSRAEGYAYLAGLADLCAFGGAETSRYINELTFDEMRQPQIDLSGWRTICTVLTATTAVTGAMTLAGNALIGRVANAVENESNAQEAVTRANRRHDTVMLHSALESRRATTELANSLTEQRSRGG